MIRAPYVLYGVKYIDLVSLAPFSGCAVCTAFGSKSTTIAVPPFSDTVGFCEAPKPDLRGRIVVRTCKKITGAPAHWSAREYADAVTQCANGQERPACGRGTNYKNAYCAICNGRSFSNYVTWVVRAPYVLYGVKYIDLVSLGKKGERCKNLNASPTAGHSQILTSRPFFFKMACKQNLDLRCVLVPAPWVLWPKHVSNPE